MQQVREGEAGAGALGFVLFVLNLGLFFACSLLVPSHARATTSTFIIISIFIVVATLITIIIIILATNCLISLFITPFLDTLASLPTSSSFLCARALPHSLAI
jgi:protein-S-isoprenylcysteine O-methyltransferase Ste14